MLVCTRFLRKSVDDAFIRFVSALLFTSSCFLNDNVRTFVRGKSLKRSPLILAFQ